MSTFRGEPQETTVELSHASVLLDDLAHVPLNETLAAIFAVAPGTYRDRHPKTINEVSWRGTAPKGRLDPLLSREGMGMTYRDYLSGQSDLMVRTSDVESRASGWAVGRLEVWPPRSTCGQDVARLIGDSGLDVVIVRAGAEDVELAATMNTEAFISWQADTLLYFTIAAESLAAGSAPDGLVRMTPGDESDTDVLVERIFADYKNHYSANPALRRINVVTAYQDWTRTALGSNANAVFKALSVNGAPAGLCVMSSEDESYDEILLAGIVPEQRGHGAYQDMIRMIGVRAQAASKESVVISTQAANIGVMRAWCRLGFLPTIALNTFHVVRRDIHRAALVDEGKRVWPEP